jgi:PAS domain S-box-containing protein
MREHDTRPTTSPRTGDDGGWTTPARIALVAVGYFAAYRLAFLFREPGMAVSAVWPAAGVAVAALVLNPARLRPLILATVFATAVTADLIAGHRLVITASFAIANTFEGLACSWVLLRWGTPHLRFERRADIVALAGAALLVNACTAVIGTAFAVLITGAPAVTTWLRWWVSDGLGILVVTPLIVSWARPRSAVAWPRWPRVLEVVCFALVFCPTVWLAFELGTRGANNGPVFTASLALLTWPALRFGQRGTTLAVLALAGIGVVATLSDGAPGSDFSTRVLGVQAFVAVAALSSFLLAAVYAEATDAAGAAREEQVRLAAISDHLPDGMVYQTLREHDGRMRFVHLSAGVERLHGVTAEQAVLDASLIYGQVLDEDRAALSAAEEESARTMNPLRIIVRVRRSSDGAIRWRQVSSSPLALEDGRVRWDGVELDVTDQQEAEHEKDLLREQLLQSQKMEAVGRLAGGVAHDFNNLLTVILGHVSLLEDAGCPADASGGDLAAIRQAAERAAGLTSRLLAFSRKSIVAPRDIRVGDIIRSLEGMLRRLLGEDVELLVEDKASRAVRIDPSQLEQVVANLAVNARDAMLNGGRLTIATADARLAPGGMGEAQGPPVAAVSLTVSDEGRGMAPEVMARLFEPFFTTKEAGKGTGLGLSTVHGIVTQAGGQVSATSTEGKGSVFSVLLPAIDAPAAHQEAGARKPVASGSETILLAEDDPAVRTLIATILAHRGYRVVEAADGHEALAWCERNAEQCALLITDVVMPGLGGAELAERVSALRPGIGVLLLSGYTEDSTARRDAASGAKPFLQKPFTPETLSAKVREVLDGRAAG